MRNQMLLKFIELLETVLSIRDIFVRIRIPRSVPLTDPDPIHFFSDFKENFLFSIFLPTGTLSSFLKI